MQGVQPKKFLRVNSGRNSLLITVIGHKSPLFLVTKFNQKIYTTFKINFGNIYVINFDLSINKDFLKGKKRTKGACEIESVY